MEVEGRTAEIGGQVVTPDVGEFRLGREPGEVASGGVRRCVSLCCVCLRGSVQLGAVFHISPNVSPAQKSCKKQAEICVLLKLFPSISISCNTFVFSKQLVYQN